MNKLRHLLSQTRALIAKFDRDMGVWHRVIYGIEPKPVSVQAPEPQIFALTGEELRARLAEVIQ